MRRIRIIALSALAIALVVVPAAWALKIAKTPPPTGYVGQPYYFDFQPEDGQGCSPYTFRVDSGVFPPGLSISTDDGIVTGTPTQVGTFQFYLQMRSCAGNATDSQFTITIEQKLTISTNSPLPDAAIGQPYAPVQLTASGGTVSSWGIQSGALPAGMTLTSAGLLSGTPTVSGVFEIVALAQGGGKSDTKRLGLTVTAPLVLGGPGGVPPKSEPVARNTKVGASFSWTVLATGGVGTVHVLHARSAPCGPRTGQGRLCHGNLHDRRRVARAVPRNRRQGGDGRPPGEVQRQGSARVRRRSGPEGREGRIEVRVACPGHGREQDEDVPRKRRVPARPLARRGDRLIVRHSAQGRLVQDQGLGARRSRHADLEELTRSRSSRRFGSAPARPRRRAGAGLASATIGTWSHCEDAFSSPALGWSTRTSTGRSS